MDLIISTYLNSFLENKFIAWIVFIFADAPIFILPLFLISFWFYYNHKNNINWKKTLLYIFYWIVLGILINLIIQHIVFIDRPLTSLKNAWKLILNHIPDASFPSDHATTSFAFLTGLFYFKYKKLFITLLPIYLLMNLSRIMWWVHWLSDVLWGLVVWIISWSIINYFKENKYILKLNDFLLKIASFIKL